MGEWANFWWLPLLVSAGLQRRSVVSPYIFQPLICLTQYINQPDRAVISLWFRQASCAALSSGSKPHGVYPLHGVEKLLKMGRTGYEKTDDGVGSKIQENFWNFSEQNTRHFTRRWARKVNENLENKQTKFSHRATDQDGTTIVGLSYDDRIPSRSWPRNWSDGGTLVRVSIVFTNRVWPVEGSSEEWAFFQNLFVSCVLWCNGNEPVIK